MSVVGKVRGAPRRWIVVTALAAAVTVTATGTALANSVGTSEGASRATTSRRVTSPRPGTTIMPTANRSAAEKQALGLGLDSQTSLAARQAVAESATRCGASWQSESSGESYQEALARLDQYYGTMDILRVFYPGLPAAWPGKVNSSGRPMIISFKAAPADVTAGNHDTALRAWFAGAPKTQITYWTYYHEPENNIEDGEFSASQYRQAWKHLAALAEEAGNSQLRATLILMGWSLNPNSGRNWKDYYPGRDAIDVLGWDAYNPSWDADTPSYQSPATMFDRIIRTSNDEGLPFGIAETGSPIVTGDDGARRATWLRDLASHLTKAGAVWVTYFDIDWRKKNGADYRLRDEAGKKAWREFCDQ